MAEFWTNYLWPLLIIVVQSLLLLVLLLLITAYILYADRKIWAAVQIRRGPNVVGPWGLLQSFADLLKFLVKEPVIPDAANKGVFLLAPLVTAVLALSAWAVIPVDSEWVIADLNVGVLYIFAISSLMVYGVIMAGWSSNSKYPFLASLRSAAQMVSYEVSIGFVIITVLLCAGSLNLSAIVDAQEGSYGLFDWFWLPLFPMFVVFFVSALAETNRPPFDLVEAESQPLRQEGPRLAAARRYLPRQTGIVAGVEQGTAREGDLLPVRPLHCRDLGEHRLLGGLHQLGLTEFHRRCHRRHGAAAPGLRRPRRLQDQVLGGRGHPQRHRRAATVVRRQRHRLRRNDTARPARPQHRPARPRAGVRRRPHRADRHR